MAFLMVPCIHPQIIDKAAESRSDVWLRANYHSLSLLGDTLIEKGHRDGKVMAATYNALSRTAEHIVALGYPDPRPVTPVTTVCCDGNGPFNHTPECWAAWVCETWPVLVKAGRIADIDALVNAFIDEAGREDGDEPDFDEGGSNG